ncbi:MAG: lysylphosphatidylglycerol synthase transmembrane domain-containing protein [Candidatus Aerophobetes bacterium]|nr:lysylphosphatidylglycerol synthase transmembrane domain-containing protein [Candidatus Aerophobetes bacterium]
MKKNFFVLLSTLAGILLLILMFYLIGVEQIFSSMGEIGWAGATVFTANTLFIVFISALSWQMILNSYGYHLPFRDVMVARVIGFAVSYLTPSIYIGGEPLRIYLISKKHSLSVHRVGATVIVSKFLESGAGLFFIYLGSICTLIEYSLPLNIYLAILVINVIFGLGAGIILRAFICQKKIFTYLANLLGRARFLSNPINKIKSDISEVEEGIFLAFSQHKRETILAFGLNLAGELLIFLKPAIFFYFLKIFLKFSQLALLFALTHFLLALQLTPGALGIFELGEIGIFRLVGIGPEKALAFTLMVRIADFIGVGIAAIFGLHLGLKTFLGAKDK